ncbi:MAG: 16S rRNA (guanine(966)-N(2))-methyltransferase RsmD [Anaerolineae bacterium]
MVRVITGSAKGRRLLSVPGTGTRPVTDRVKESLFDILGADVEDSTWLDLFAGTGSIGIEALSRGARHVVFIDKAHQAVTTIRRNLEMTGFLAQSELIRGDALRYIAQAAAGTRFDYIYVAPPQYEGMWATALRALDEHPLIAPDSLVIVQIHPKEYAAARLSTLELVSERRYGSTLLLFYGVPESVQTEEHDAASG